MSALDRIARVGVLNNEGNAAGWSAGSDSDESSVSASLSGPVSASLSGAVCSSEDVAASGCSSPPGTSLGPGPLQDNDAKIRTISTRTGIGLRVGLDLFNGTPPCAVGNTDPIGRDIQRVSILDNASVSQCGDSPTSHSARLRDHRQSLAGESPSELHVCIAGSLTHRSNVPTC